MNKKVDIRKYKGEETKDSLVEKLREVSTESVLVVTIDNKCMYHGWAGLSELEVLGLIEAVKYEILEEGGYS